MALRQLNWITFAGEPAAGMPPPQLLVAGGAELTPEQIGGVVAAYRQFKQRTLASVAPYQTDERVLADGTTVRIESLAGRDRVLVAPAKPAAALVLIEYFRTIPADSTAISGTGPKESKFWKLTGDLSDWPDELKDASALADHPGHVMWSNPNLKLGKIPIVLTWRGPRDRYAISTGWTQAGSITFGGNPIGESWSGMGTSTTPRIAHEEAGAAIGPAIYKDSGYVWIDGRRLDTGLTKVVAGCICQPDAVGDPGKFVLRVCTDYIAGARGFKIVDLAPGGVAVGLKTLCEANSLSVVNTYTAAHFQANAASASSWDMLQRPHFNRSGTKLATIVVLNGTGVVGAVFDAVTWAIDSTVTTPHVGSSSTVLNSHTGDPAINSTWAYDSTAARSNDYTCLVAMDFDGDTLAWVKARHLETHSVNIVAHATLGVPSVDSYTDAWSITWSMTHSALGTLHTHTVTGSDTGSVSSGGAGSFSKAAQPNVAMQFIGDLARASFAVGHTTANVFDASSSSTYTHVDTATSYWDWVATFYEARLTFDVYLDAVLVATATTGGFTNAAAGTFSSGARVSIGGWESVLPVAASSGPTTVDGASGIAYANCNSACPGFGVLYKHCAVHPLRGIAYFGGLFYKESDTGERGHTPKYGIEIGAFNPAGTPAVHNPPAYSPGTFPTLDASVFQGPSTTGVTP